MESLAGPTGSTRTVAGRESHKEMKYEFFEILYFENKGRTRVVLPEFELTTPNILSEYEACNVAGNSAIGAPFKTDSFDMKLHYKNFDMSTK